MGQVNSVTLGAAAALLLLGVYAVLFRGPRSQLGRMPGPGRRHFFFGNMREVWADPDARERWVKAYGPVINVANIFNVRRAVFPPCMARADAPRRSDRSCC
jgi:hypothetical protein